MSFGFNDSQSGGYLPSTSKPVYGQPAQTPASPWGSPGMSIPAGEMETAVPFAPSFSANDSGLDYFGGATGISSWMGGTTSGDRSWIDDPIGPSCSLPGTGMSYAW